MTNTAPSASINPSWESKVAPSVLEARRSGKSELEVIIGCTDHASVPSRIPGFQEITRYTLSPALFGKLDLSRLPEAASLNGIKTIEGNPPLTLA